MEMKELGERFILRRLIIQCFSEATKRLTPEQLAYWIQIVGQIEKRYPKILKPPIYRFSRAFPEPPREAILLMMLLPPLVKYLQRLEVPRELAEKLVLPFVEEDIVLEKTDVESAREDLLISLLMKVYWSGWLDAKRQQ